MSSTAPIRRRRFALGLVVALALIAGCGLAPKGDAGPLHDDLPPDEAGARVGVSIPIGD